MLHPGKYIIEILNKYEEWNLVISILGTGIYCIPNNTIKAHLIRHQVSRILQRTINKSENKQNNLVILHSEKKNKQM